MNYADVTADLPDRKMDTKENRDFWDAVDRSAILVKQIADGRQSVTGDASKLPCPSCGYLNDFSDEDGLVHEGDYECKGCDAQLQLSNVKVIGTVRSVP